MEIRNKLGRHTDFGCYSKKWSLKNTKRRVYFPITQVNPNVGNDYYVRGRKSNLISYIENRGAWF